MPEFAVTIERIVTTVVIVPAASAAEARKWVEDYGVVEAASDMATDDDVTAHIKSVRRAKGL